MAQSDDLQEKAEEYAARFVAYRESPFEFIYDMWGRVPQPVKPAYEEKWKEMWRARGDRWREMLGEVSAEWFGDWDEETGDWQWHDFEKSKHITWQQTIILLGVKKGYHFDETRHLAIRSGHGIGKTAVVSWIILWFLFCFRQAQVPVTAPTSQQMHDVLWKELHIWITSMPEVIQPMFEWQSTYVRMTRDPEEWFARARTSTKENTEAIAGVHSDHVLIAVDEASGVPEAVYNTAMGSLTSGNVFVILIGNPTRNEGFFYNAHKRYQGWQRFAFDGEQSPLVDKDYVAKMEQMHGTDSDEYAIRVKGEFPEEGEMDDTGYVQLIPPSNIHVQVTEDMSAVRWIGRPVLGLDPAGEGTNKSVFVLRDQFKAAQIHSENNSNPRQLAEKVLTFIDRYSLDPGNVVVDAFGVGADIGKEVSQASKGRYSIYTPLVGNNPVDEENYNPGLFARQENEKDAGEHDLYANLRAVAYARGAEWLSRGGMILDTLVDNSPFSIQLPSVKYKRSLHGNRIQLMPKHEMRKLGLPSPDTGDAWSLTFLRSTGFGPEDQKEQQRRVEADEKRVDDPYSVL